MDDPEKQASKIAKRAGQSLSWFTIGQVLGRLAGLLVPDNIITDDLIAHSLASLLAAISALGLFSRFKSRAGTDLSDCLSDADLLFSQGRISERELNLLRQKCLEKHWK